MRSHAFKNLHLEIRNAVVVPTANLQVNSNSPSLFAALPIFLPISVKDACTHL